MHQYAYTLRKLDARYTVHVTACDQFTALQALRDYYSPEFDIQPTPTATYAAHHVYGELDASECDPYTPPPCPAHVPRVRRAQALRQRYGLE